jgi:hypothetical protein
LKTEDQENPRISTVPLFFYPLGSFTQEINSINADSKRNFSTEMSKEDRMTIAQRRFLYRLLTEKKNLKGKEIEEYLKEKFDVGDLDDIDKSSASQLIDSLLNGGE